MAAAVRSPFYLCSTLWVFRNFDAYLHCRGVRVEASMEAASWSPFYLYSTPRVLRNFVAYLYSMGVRVEAAMAGSRASPPSTSTTKPTTGGGHDD